MDFKLSDEIQKRAKETREWVENVLDPISGPLETEERFPKKLMDELQRGKFFGVTIPKEYGGEGLSFVDWFPLLEEFSRGYAFVRMMAHAMNGILWRSIYFYGPDWMKKEILPKMATGEMMVANCITEPEAGTGKDINTKAVKVGDKWVLNGRKWLISMFPGHPYFYITFANTDEGIICFGVDDQNPGLRLEPMERMMGTVGPRHYVFHFEDCEVPEENILGEKGKGFNVAFDILALSRVSIAACCVGVAQKFLDLSLDYAKKRYTFGKPISKRQAIQWSLAEMGTDIEAGRLLYQRAAWMYEQGMTYDMEAAMAKVFTEEMVTRVSEKALRLHGGVGYTQAYPIERMFRDCRSFHFEEGTAEIQKLVISRELLQKGLGLNRT